jgi:hypothetical protein
LIDFLPHIVPNLKKFNSHASRIFLLLRTGCGKFPLDILRHYKDSTPRREDESDEEYGFHYDLGEDEEEVSPISLGSYAYLLFMANIDKKYLPQYVSFSPCIFNFN